MRKLQTMMILYFKWGIPLVIACDMYLWLTFAIDGKYTSPSFHNKLLTFFFENVLKQKSGIYISAEKYINKSVFLIISHNKIS